MKTQVLILLCCCLSAGFLFAQSDAVKNFVREGAALHDEGKYSEAIAVYEKALKLEPKSSLVHYEIGYSYFGLKNYQKALQHMDVVIKNNTTNVMQAMLLKGSIQDDLGSSKKAIKTYQQALKKYPNYYLLHYNLALTAYRQKNKDLAIKSLYAAIANNPSHASSHFLLANIQYEDSKMVESVLASYFLLLLEPSGQRAQVCLTIIEEKFFGAVSKQDSAHINISLSPNLSKSDFRSVQLLVALQQAKIVGERKEEVSKEVNFYDNTKLFFDALKDEKNKKDTPYWSLYIPFFTKMTEAGHLEVFTNFIYQSKSETCVKWLETHSNEIDDFKEWVKKD